jgi:Zn-dependent protease with chaperone function
VLKSFFTRGHDQPPGIEFDLSEAPGLRTILDEVAAKVGTRPVDRVYLEAGADIAVFERGGMLEKLRGKGERCLLLGAAVLDGLDTHAFKAILAHEYGHFSNEDTAGGNLALGVRRSVVHSAVGLAQAGAAGWYNPAWVFLNGFHRVFLRISQGASRLQEVLADRWAAQSYGASAFERGLRHAIAADLAFDAHAQATIREVVEQRRGLRNLYAHVPAATEDEPRDLAAAVEEAVHAEPTPYDSHPRPADRFRWARAIASDSGAEPQLGPPVWSVFLDRAAIEERLTDVIRMRVAAQIGVVIPGDRSDLAEESGDWHRSDGSDGSDGGDSDDSDEWNRSG